MSQRIPAAQNAFNSGVFSPRLYGRSDVVKYRKALETAENCICLPHGPLIKRNGSKYIATAKFNDKNTRLVKFQKSVGDAFILEFGDLYIRFFENGAVVGGPLELVTTYTESEVFDLEFAQFGDDIYITHSAHETARLHRTNSTTWLLETLAITSAATVEDGEKPITTLTPSATTGLAVTFTAGADAFKPNDVGRQLIYRDNTTDELLGVAIIVGNSSATVVTADIIITFPNTNAIVSQNWKIDLTPNVTITPTTKAIGSVCTVTSIAGTWKDNAQFSYVGKFIHVHGGIVRIDDVGTELSISGEVVKALDAITATDNWTLEEAAWSSSRGWPKAIGIFEERLWLGGTVKQEQNLWGSKSGDFTKFGRGADDSDPLDLLVSDSIASPISWISTGRDLIIGGTSGEFTISSDGGFITPSDRTIRLRSSHGGNVQQPQKIGNEVIFLEAGGLRIRSVSYDFEQDTYDVDDLLFLADHLTKELKNPGIKEIAVAQKPNSLIYGVLNTGGLVVGSYIKSQDVLGWQPFKSAGKYKSVASIDEGTNSEVWVVVDRLINGSSVRYIERFDEFDINNGLTAFDGFSDSFVLFGTDISVSDISTANPVVVTATGHGLVADDIVIFYDAEFEDEDGILQDMLDVNKKTFTVEANGGDPTNKFNLKGIDGALFETYDSNGVVIKKETTITGLSTLEGREILVKVDNAAHGNKTVSGGSITLDSPGGRVLCGLAYTMTAKTLKPSTADGVGFEGQQIRFTTPILRLFKSKLPTINGQLKPIRDSGMLMNVAPDLFTGDAEYSSTDYKDLGQIEIIDTSPFPIMINGIFGIVEIGDR